MNVSAGKQLTTRLPKLATMAFVFWGLSASSQLGTAHSWAAQAAMPAETAPGPLAEDNNQRVLSEKDAGLYRAAFAAQEMNDWASADQALAKIKNKKLLGHVLAHRYLKRGITLPEAKAWFAAYSELSEAPQIYARAKRLSGFKEFRVAVPKTAAAPQPGQDAFGAPASFPSVNDNDAPRVKNSTVAEINAALRQGDPMKGRDILSAAVGRGAIPISKSTEHVARIAAAFYFEGDVARARPMAHLAGQVESPLGLWIEGLSAWKQRDFGSASFAFGKLARLSDLSARNRSAAAFWAYRTARAQGDRGQAFRWLAEAAKNPQTFYGALAARLAGKGPERSWRMPELNAQNISILKSRPAGWHALALAQVGQRDLAEGELRLLVSSSSRDVKTASLALAEKERMASLVFQLSGVARHEDGKPFVAALYPVPHWKPSDGFKVDRALLFALMRHESQFDPSAVSPRGACGLMQIMPATAKHISNDNFATRSCPDQLFDPVRNMELGQKYVRHLGQQRMIGDNLLLLLAAYNGGPGNLQRWLGDNTRNDPLLFIESVPVRETREYVQNVFLQYWMYRSRLSQPDTAMAQLARGEWPRYALRDEPSASQHAEAAGRALASLEPARATGAR